MRPGRFIGVEALDCTPRCLTMRCWPELYSASNFGSITPLANQMTALNQSANSECPNSWMLFGAHKSPSRAPRRQHRLRADISSPAKRFCQFCMVFVALLSRFVPARDLLVCAKNLFAAGGWAGDVRLITSNLFYNARLRALSTELHLRVNS
jgi:hypothetical protein